MIQYFILAIYFLLLTFIFIYSLAQLHLLINYFKWKKTASLSTPPINFTVATKIPYVTIQLPIYNEEVVGVRLIKQICKLNYPTDKLEIQVLDDSTDASAEANKACVNAYQQRGINIVYLHRKNRKGFKAGALKDGLKIAKGEYIAIFDADFLPEKEWLYQTLPYFTNPKIGVVQTRWGHLNRSYSFLTKIQAFALDFHFTIEQIGRNYGRHFINFNGTAGIWRKTCILDAGNWQGDTLTEDLDLSYRAQMKGWEFKYISNIETPAELPILMSATRSQQFRWNKGAAENFQKNFAPLIGQKHLKWTTKTHAFFHLLNSSIFLIILLLAIFSIPVLYIKSTHPDLVWLFYVMTFLGISTLIFALAFSTSYRLTQHKKKSIINFLSLFLGFFSIAMGMSLNNSIAVIEGHWGKKSSFVRTPKFNSIQDKKTNLNTHKNSQFSWIFLVELFLFIYFLFGIYSAFSLKDFGLLPFHIMLSFGFGYVFLKTIK